MPDSVVLRVNLAESPVLRAIRSGAVRSDLVTFDFCGPPVAYDGFKPMLREAAFDAGELAIGTLFQAKRYGKPLVALPAVTSGRFQHPHIVYRTALGKLTPKDIEGCRFAVRSYSQTTGFWVRAILKHQFGVDLNRVRWVVTDEPHLFEHRDPPNVEQDARTKSVEQLLLDGDVDGAVVAREMPEEPRVRPLIPDASAQALAWYRETGIAPINHLFVIARKICEDRPDVVREVYRMLRESRTAAGAPADGIDFNPFGVAAMRNTLQAALGFALEQKLIDRPIQIEDVFEGAPALPGA